MKKRYVCTAVLCSVVLAVLLGPRPAHAQAYSESVIYSFCETNGTCTDGRSPAAALVQGTDGDFYSTTTGGGTGMTASEQNNGTAFKITPSGTLTTLYDFCSLPDCDDGRYPGGIVLGTDGNFYGTTSDAGDYGKYGTAFKMTPAGALLTLYSFCSVGTYPDCTDGWSPVALVEGKDGNFYGLTYEGGPTNSGTFFRITSSGTLTTLYDFCSVGGNLCTDGQYPSGLVLGTDGNFYGTTASTIFKLTTASALTTLYTVCTSGDCGRDPAPGLTQGRDGNLYGVMLLGGSNPGSGLYGGTVFRITTAGVFTTLYNFCSVGGSLCSDGEYPRSAPTQGADGNFYGTTMFGGGVNAGGTVYQMTPAGILTTLYSFCSVGGYPSCTDGSTPEAQLLQTKDGSFYGTTFDGGGSSSTGTVFKLSLAATATSTTALTVSPSSAQLGQPVTLTAKVSSSQGTPTGSVIFYVNSKLMGPVTLDGSGMATFQLNTLGYSVGTYPVVAAYSGSSVDNLSQSTVMSLVLVKDTLMANLRATPNPVTPPQSVTFELAFGYSDVNPTGTVTFSVFGNSLGSVPLTNNGSTGFAYLTVSTNGVPYGSYPIVATYSGDSNYNGVQSAPLQVVIAKAATSTIVTGAPNPVSPPTAVTLIAAVERSAQGVTGVPTGTVTFLYLGVTLGTASLNQSGQASLTIPTASVPAGTYPITVQYGGDGSDAASTSAPLSLKVN